MSFPNKSMFCPPVVKDKASLPSMQTHVQIWSWSAQTQYTSSQPISLCFQSHTTHYFVNVLYLALSFSLQYRTSSGYCTRTWMHRETKYHETGNLQLYSKNVFQLYTSYVCACARL